MKAHPFSTFIFHPKNMDILTKISKFEFSNTADEQVLRFEIAVQNVAAMDICQATQQLKEEELKEKDAALRLGSRGQLKLITLTVQASLPWGQYMEELSHLG